MESSGLGGGVMLAVAALLWMLYLLPTWFKRRQYLSTERNAVRLQQTIRVLAETAEMPDVVRAGLRGARAVSESAPTRLAEHPSLPARYMPLPLRSRAHRLRRARAATSVFLLGAIVTAITQAALMATTGAVAGSMLVLAAAAFVALSAFAMLGRLAATSRALRSEVQPVLVRPRVVVREPVAQPRPGWTPVPVPKPLYLDRPNAQQIFATGTAAELQAAAAASERLLRQAQQEPEVIPISRPAAGRFARMGIVDVPQTEQPDLDAVLRRRRAAG